MPGVQLQFLEIQTREVLELAAVPPPMSRPVTLCRQQAWTALRVSTSVTASWKEAPDIADRDRLVGVLPSLNPACHRGPQGREREVQRARRDTSRRAQRYGVRGNCAAASQRPRRGNGQGALGRR